MASIRRTLSPVPRGGTLLNGEACSVSSPLSKSSSCTPSSTGSPLSSSVDSHSALYRLLALIFGVSPQRSSRPVERSKLKGQVWRRAVFHFVICFAVGVFIGLTPFASMNLLAKHQAFSFRMISTTGNFQSSDLMPLNIMPLTKSQVKKNNASSESQVKKQELINETTDDSLMSLLLIQNSNVVSHKLLIIVTPTYAQPLQAFYLNRLAHTLKVVPPPLLWIVVEMNSQSSETADILRRTGVMYRHLVCNKNLSDIRHRSIHLRNVALSHIETHRLDGIVFFADDDIIYSVDLFEEMRHIRRFGTWMVAVLMQSKSKFILEGPVCNGTQVIGWHTDERTRKFQRFHADISGFAFNSTILWDPKRWHRPTLEPIRQLDTVKEGFQVSTFVEQVVEDESQMEGLPQNCYKIMVWHPYIGSSYSFYPPEWFVKNNLDVIIPLN